MIVVAVLITSCQVSLKWKMGHVTSQATMTATASTKTRGRPQKCADAFANLEYQLMLFIPFVPCAIILNRARGLQAGSGLRSITLIESYPFNFLLHAKQIIVPAV